MILPSDGSGAVCKACPANNSLPTTPVMSARPVIKVAALCSSLRKASFNRGLIRSGKPPSSSSVIKVDIAPFSFLNTNLKVSGTFPEPVEAFSNKIREADAFLFASPEYNYSVTGTSAIQNLNSF